MTTAAISLAIVIAQPEGDRPAIITKVFNNTSVEVCAFMPEPTPLALVKLHPSRREAIRMAEQTHTGWAHAYWPAKA